MMTIAFIDQVHPVLAERLTEAGHTCIDLHTASDTELRQQLAAVNGIVVTFRDVSDQVRAQEEINRQRDLATTGAAVAAALNRCVDGQKQLVIYIRNALAEGQR